MAITYPLTPPANPSDFAGVTISPAVVVGGSRSPFSLIGQFYAHQGQLWRGGLRLPTMDRATAEEWVAFLLALNGRAGTFLMGISGSATARGALGGTPLVNGAGQTGQVLNIDGLSINITNWGRKGDCFSLGTGENTHLHKLLLDVNSNGSGQATLDFWPRLRASPADNDPVTFVSPKGLWRLASNEMPYELRPPLLYEVSFEVEEAL